MTIILFTMFAWIAWRAIIIDEDVLAEEYGNLFQVFREHSGIDLD